MDRSQQICDLEESNDCVSENRVLTCFNFNASFLHPPPISSLTLGSSTTCNSLDYVPTSTPHFFLTTPPAQRAGAISHCGFSPHIIFLFHFSIFSSSFHPTPVPTAIPFPSLTFLLFPSYSLLLPSNSFRLFHSLLSHSPFFISTISNSIICDSMFIYLSPIPTFCSSIPIVFSPSLSLHLTPIFSSHSLRHLLLASRSHSSFVA